MRTDRQKLPANRTNDVMEAAVLSTEYGLLHALKGADHRRPALPPEYGRPAANLLTIAVGRPTWQLDKLEGRWPTPQVVDYSRQPVGILPTYLQEVSPRIAMQMVNAPLSMFTDLEGYRALRLAGYGVVQDYFLKSFETVRSRTNHIATLLERPGLTPFATMVSREPVAQDDVQEIVSFATARANAAQLPEDYEFEPEVEEHEVLRALLFEPWDGATLWESPRLVLAQRLAICRAWPECRKGSLTAAQLMSISRCTGISPASFLRYAVQDLHRRKVTYVSADEAYGLADEADRIVATAPESTARLKVWAMQIRRAAEALSDAYRQEWSANKLVTALIRTRPDGRNHNGRPVPPAYKRVMPEWGWATTLTRTELGLAG